MWTETETRPDLEAAIGILIIYLLRTVLTISTGTPVALWIPALLTLAAGLGTLGLRAAEGSSIQDPA